MQDKCVELLLERGANPNLRDFGGMTPLKLASLNPKILSLIHKQQVSEHTTHGATQRKRRGRGGFWGGWGGGGLRGTMQMLGGKVMRGVANA